jgi:hypothetical protein
MFRLKNKGHPKPKRKSKRVQMSELFRKECAPVLYELGFRHPKAEFWHPGPITRKNVFARWRGEDYDEILFNWWSYGTPKFDLELSTRQVERDKANLGNGKSYAWTYGYPRERSLLSRRPTRYVEVFSARFAKPEDVIARAKERLLAVDSWFLSPQPTGLFAVSREVRGYVPGLNAENDEFYWESAWRSEQLDESRCGSKRRRR